MMFADVRGSTTLAENVGTSEFTRQMHRFYDSANRIVIHNDGMVDKLVGDEVIGLFVPVFAGESHAAQAVRSAQEILHATRHDRKEGPWLPIGVGVHTGPVYIGSVGAEGAFTDLSVLGDAVNVAARLASNAAAGELVVSEATCSAAGFEPEDCDERELSLKGRAEPVHVRVLRVSHK